MLKVFNNILAAVLVLLIFSTLSYGQYTPSTERGDATYRTKGQMEGNRIRTTIHNFAFTGRIGGEFPINVQTPYEWPKNTGQVYLALTALFVGAEVTDQNGDIIKIVDLPAYRTSPEGKTWNFEPVPGYFNDNRETREIATSVDETTWPDYWPDKLNDETDPGWAGSWNGLAGKGEPSADQEIYYRISDDKYDRYSAYFPDSTDLTRKGMGIMMDVRVLAWSQFLVQDAIYIIHNVKNDGTEDLPKVAVTAWQADFVGGNGDSQDDISEFDLLLDIGFSRDRDHKAPDFGSDPVGIVGQVFLETPGNSSDRIDNDGDGEEFGPKVTEEMLVDEIVDNLIDDNGNGLIDENQTHIAFQDQVGVTYADRIDQNGDSEIGGPVVTEEMVSLASGDKWHRWPINPETDAIQKGLVHILMLDASDVGANYADGIDNDDDGEENSPTVTQAMIDAASSDAPYFRYKVSETGVILYNLQQDDLGKIYADGIDNDGNGAIDEYIDEGIDELVDEARDNGIDDDGDWDPITDDVGLDGIAQTGDQGENDGKPTSGAPYGLPGEPNIDVTDVSETDQIGITNAQYEAAGSYNFGSVSDIQLWFDLMRPGFFYNPLEVTAGEYDLFISSGFFPLKSGRTEPVSVAVVLANAAIPDPDGELRKAEIVRKTVRVQETYDNDYQFANAPIPPVLTAVPGDNKVTLYWDDRAESSFDKYIDKIGGVGYDFEGYKVYRTRDAAFQDIENITNAYGTQQFKTAIAQWDLVNEYSGFDSVGIDGVKYYLGANTGLQHTFVDTTVQNGFRYYYAVVSYDRGYPFGEIIPSESPIRLTLNSDGSVTAGENVAVVVPEAAAAGYVPPTLGDIKLVDGTTTGKISYNILDLDEILDGHVYHITFEDTTIAGESGKPDTLTTKSYTLYDSTDAVILIDRNTNIASGMEQPVVDGFQLVLENEEKVEINTEKSGWNNDGIRDYTFEKFAFPEVSGDPVPNDYVIIFGDLGVGRSTEITLPKYPTFPAKDVNFEVYNKSKKEFIDFGFIELDTEGGEGYLTASKLKEDRIVFLEENSEGTLRYTWTFYLDGLDVENRFPSDGDSNQVLLRKPFLSSDQFRFVAHSSKIETEQAKIELDDIKVVPNPYIATASWERKNPYNSGRGPRELHFTHLPAQCTIRIFTINGELVQTIYHDNPQNDGTAKWDMLSRDNLGISYGVYIYHVDAPGIGEKIGKFAVIK